MPQASAPQPQTSVSAPSRPESIAEVGVRKSFLEELALKVLSLNSPLSVRQLSEHLHLSYSATDELFRRLREMAYCEVTSMVGNVPNIAVTNGGRNIATQLLALNQYSGPAPVSLQSYVQQVRRQSVSNVLVHPPQVQQAFSDLVLEPKILKQLGTALNSGTSIFLYGPTGSGKTTLAEALTRVFAEDAVWIPHAVEVDGQVIAVFDPVTHKRLDDSAFGDSYDRRWVLCRRPAVMVGGELTIEALDLQFNPVARFYAAPVQMKANNGVLIIDDFGRQRLRPEELLNRWVVPLDRRIDFLTLAGGRKIEVPFEMFVVFATNLDPASLADQAFLRRIQTKILVDNVTPQQFHEIFRRRAQAIQLSYDPRLVDELIRMIQQQIKEPLRACHPRDILNHIGWAARYEGSSPRLDHSSLKDAVDAYFVAPKDGGQG